MNLKSAPDGESQESLDETLRVIVHPFLSERLLSRGASAHLAAISARLPARLTSHFGYACRLGGAEARADLQLAVRRWPGGELVAEGRELGRFEGLAWERLRAFCGLWSQSEEALADRVLHLWWEFDGEASGAAEPVPAVYLRPREDLLVPGADLGWWTEASRVLTGRVLSAPVIARVGRCLGALPPGAWVYQVAARGEPRPASVRLRLRGFVPHQVPAYLEAVGWTGDRAALQEALGRGSPLLDTLALELDVGEEVRPGVSLDCYVRPGPDHSQRLWRFLEALEGWGLCSAEQRAGLMAFPGVIHQGAAPEAWPGHLRGDAPFVPPGAVSTFVRRLHHVSLALRPSRLEASAALRVRHQWCSRTQLDALLFWERTEARRGPRPPRLAR